MRNNKCGLTLLATLLLCLAGCGTGENAALADEERSLADAAKAASEAAQEAAGTGQKEKAAEQEADDAALNDVENAPGYNISGNGGYFVEVDGKIYFHIYEDEAFEDYAYDGDMLLYTVGGASLLVSYSEADGSISNVADDGATGPLYRLGDSFYCGYEDKNGAYVLKISDDGESGEFAQGAIAGISEGGDYMAVYDYSTTGAVPINVYDASGSLAYTLTPGEDGMIFCGMSGGSVIYITRSKEDGTTKLFAEDASGSRELGILSKSPIYDEIRCYDFSHKGDEVYMKIGWYGGPVNMLEESVFAVVEADKENSLKELTQDYGVIGEKVYLEHGSYGDLILSQDGKETVLQKQFIQYQDRDYLKLAAAQYLSGRAYMMVASVTRDYDNSIAGHIAYKYDEMYYLTTDGSSPAVTLEGEDWIMYHFDEQAYESFIGEWEAEEEGADAEELLPVIPETRYHLSLNEDFTSDFSEDSGFGEGLKLSIYDYEGTWYINGSDPDSGEDVNFSAYMEDDEHMRLTVHQTVYHNDGTSDYYTYFYRYKRL